MQDFAVGGQRQGQLFGHVHAAHRVLHEALAFGRLPRGIPWRSRSQIRPAERPAHELHDPGNQQNPKQKPQNPSHETHGL